LVDLDGDGAPDANPIGSGINAGSTAGSFIRIGGAATFLSVYVAPSPATTDSDFDSVPDQAIHPDYVNGKVVSFNIFGFPQTAPVASSGSGQIFASIVVPTGISVQLYWQMGGEIGDPFVGTYVDWAPLPPPPGTWSGEGGNANWSTGANWTDGTAPPPGTALTFTGTTRLANNNDLPAGTSFNGISFTSTAGAFVLSGNSIQLTGDIASSSSSLQTINLDMELVGARQVNTGSGGITISGALSGTGSLTKTGTGTLTLTGANTYTGGTTVTAGTLKGNATSLQGNILNNATLVFDQASGGTFAGSISGSGNIVKMGNGLLVLAGANSFTGTMTISAGAVQGNSASLTGDIVNDGFLIIDQSFDGTMAGSISGNGSLLKTGSGKLILGGTNSYTGGTTINAGTLQGSSLSLVGNISSSAAVIFDQPADGTYSGILSGSGSLTKTGTGTLTLAGANTFTGTTTIEAGAISVPALANLGGATSAIVLGGGATEGALVYTGNTATLSRAMTISAGGGRIEATSAGQTLTVAGAISTAGHLTFGGAGNVQVTGGISGSGSLAKTDSGKLTLTGASSYTGGTTISAGTLEGSTTSLVGSITNNASLVFNQAADGTYGGVVSGTGMLIKTGTGKLTLTGSNSYTGGTTVSAGTLEGSTASLVGSITNNASLVFNQPFDGTYSDAVSGSGSLAKTGSGKLVLAGANSYTGGTTVTAGVLEGSTSSLTGNITNNASLVFNQSFDGTYSGAMSGTGSLTKTGSGTVTLAGTNSFTGTTTIEAGAISVPALANLGAGTSAIVLGGSATEGTLVYTGSTATLSRGFDVATGGGRIEATLVGQTLTVAGAISTAGPLTFGGAGNVQVTGGIGGSGSLAKSGSGTLILGGTNNYTGTTTISQGVLQCSATNLAGDILNNATLILDQVVDGSIGGSIAGSGHVTKTGSGKLTLTGSNSYTGGTTISAGSLEGSTSSLVGDINNNGSLIFDQPTDGTFAGAITGSGALTKTGAGTLTLAGANTFTGTTTIEAGAISIPALANLGGGTSAIVLGGGATEGGLVYTGSTASLSRGFVVSAGGGRIEATLVGQTLTVAGAISTAGPLTFGGAGNVQVAGGISGNGSVVKSGSGTLLLGGVNNYTGTTTISQGVLQCSATNLAGDILNNATLILDQTVDGSIGGSIAGSGQVIKTGGGKLTLTGSNSYAGGTIISAGSLEGSTSSLVGDISNNGLLIFDQPTDGSFAGAITGSGSVTKQGSGTLVLSGNSSYSGGTTLSTGTLGIGSDTALGTGALTMAAGTAVEASGGPRTVANALVLNGSVTFSGSQDLTFTDTTAIVVPAGRTLASTNTGTTILSGRVSAAAGSQLVASGLGGNFVLGDPNDLSGFASAGTILVNSGATMTLRSATYADLPPVSQLQGGTLAAPSGVALAINEVIAGHGAVTASIAAQTGSTILAQGNLSLGDASSYDGYFSDGRLYVNRHTVTLQDRNQAVLGSLTQLGDAQGDGTLSAPNGLVVDFGRNIVGHGTVSTPNLTAKPLTNNGTIAGDSPAAPITLTGYVKGVGTFDNVTFTGTYAPGLSTTAAQVGGVIYAAGSTLEVEIAGQNPGTGYDQVNHWAAPVLGGTLSIVRVGGYVPTPYQPLHVLAYPSATGRFASVSGQDAGSGLVFAAIYSATGLDLVPALAGDANLDGSTSFTDLLVMGQNYNRAGRTWTEGDFDNDGAVGFADLLMLSQNYNRTAPSPQAVPEPGAVGVLALGALGLLARRRRRRE